MGDRHPWSTLDQLVLQRHRGVLVPADGALLDIPARAVRDRAARDRLREPFPAAWLLPGVASAADVRALAAARSVGGRVLVSGWSAAAMMGLAGHPARPSLLLPHDRRSRAALAGVTVSRSRRIRASDAVVIDRVPCTTLPRTALILVAAGTQPARVRDLVIDGLQQRLTSLAALLELLEATRGVTGRPVLDAIVAELVRDRVDSGLEYDTRGIVPARWLVHPGPLPLAVPDGGVVHLDVPLPAFHHTIECDGAGFHMDRRSFETDRVRWGLIQRAGVGITWVTRRRLDTDVAGIIEEVDDAVARHDPERPPLVPAHDCRVACGRR